MATQQTAEHDAGEAIGSGHDNPLRVCVMDLGTNSFHSLIVDTYANRNFKVIDKIKESVHLGEPGLSHRSLTRGAVERALAALQRIRLLAEGRKVDEYLAYATSAIREADNGGDFIEHVRDELAIEIRTIPGDLEAELIYEGVRLAVEMSSPALIVDIGGGSTELIVATSAEPLCACSVKAGAARITERFVHNDPIDEEERRAIREFLAGELGPVLEAAKQHGVVEIVGSSGTMENLAQVCLERHGDASRTIFQQTFDPNDLLEVVHAIAGSTRAEREALSGIDAKRVGQVPAGALLVAYLLEQLDIERFRVSPNALREGMVVHFIEQNHERLQRLAPVGDVRRRRVYEILDRFQPESAHAEQVARLALALFDQLDKLHGLGARERELLEYTALLHDIGTIISRRSHHKHSYYLIDQADWPGFQPEEIAIIANVARYHRRALPKSKHEPYMALSEGDRRTVDKLASLLRLAEGLDRSQFQNVEDLSVHLSPQQVHITIVTRNDPALELWAARRSVDLFERTFGLDVSVDAAWRRS